MKNPKHIVITGASSGIGKALAEQYSAPGVVLWLCGRNKKRMAAAVKDIEKNGAKIEAHILDVCDAQAMHKALIDFDARFPVDLVIANAGVSSGTIDSDIDNWDEDNLDAAAKVMRINTESFINTIHPVLPNMRQRGQGQIAIMSSLAGFRGLSSCPAYSASKGAARLYGEGLRARHAREGIKIVTICPGFIVSRLTDQNDCPMPFMMQTDKAAQYIVKNLSKGRNKIHFPLPMVILGWTYTILWYILEKYAVRLVPNKF